MSLPENAAIFLAVACKKLLGRPDPGSMAFVRCLPEDSVVALTSDARFDLGDWRVAAVTDRTDVATRQITADVAVEWRENKTEAVLLLVDVNSAGAGMDGIYSAARELTERELLEHGTKAALDGVSHGHKGFANAARKKAKTKARNHAFSAWQEFAYLCRATGGPHMLGEALPEIGLWPIAIESSPKEEELDLSARFVERLLPLEGKRPSPEARVSALDLPPEQGAAKTELVKFLVYADQLTRHEALRRLVQNGSLWVNRLQPRAFSATSLGRITWTSWRGRTGQVLKWSGLTESTDARFELRLVPDAEERPANRARLEVRWKAEPELPKGAVEYQVEVRAGGDVLAERTVSHVAKPEQKCVFSQDDFGEMVENARFEAKVVIQALATDLSDESDEFVICFGQQETATSASAGKVRPTLVLAAIDVARDRSAFDSLIKNLGSVDRFERDKQGFIVCRNIGKSARTYCPDLLFALAESWQKSEGESGRWRIRVRANGSPASEPEFVAMSEMCSSAEGERFAQVSAAFAKWLADTRFGPLGAIYADQKPVTDYVNAAASWWESAPPQAVFAHTLEVVSLSGHRIGLVVLPTHPVRVAWQQAFDTLAAHHAYDGQVKPEKLTQLLSGLSGSQYPAMLPGLDGSSAFTFADSLGFHAVALTPIDDPEPKATVALLSRLLAGASQNAEASVAPSVGKSAATLLGYEIESYLKLHPSTRRVTVHALRPGDAMSVARALGVALRAVEEDESEEVAESTELSRIAFQLDLHPTDAGRYWCGHFLSATAARKRSGASPVPEEDRWMLESVRRPGGVTLPRLGWARRATELPDMPGHVALAFDFLSNRLDTQAQQVQRGVAEVHGLALTPDRMFESTPRPRWISVVPINPDGEKHPANRVYSDRLMKANAAIMRSVARSLGGTREDWPVMITEMSADHEDALGRLHRLCDWVVSVDRHAGGEYFDSPRDLPAAYESYLIDCVPERDDLGYLQLVTSTSSLDEIRRLLDSALSELGLSMSPTNCKRLLDALKSLSGRLALRLTAGGNTIPELLALAMVQNRCAVADVSDPTFPSLSAGYFVPIDDVPELLRAVGKIERANGERADLLYVTSAGKRGGLRIKFVEVKFRRYLKTAREVPLVEQIEAQLRSTRERWELLYGQQSSPLEKTVQRSRLVRVLRFYLRKARRHTLTDEAYQTLDKELDELGRKPSSYELGSLVDQDGGSDIGFVVCPEFNAEAPSSIVQGDATRIWLFGPGRLVTTSFAAAAQVSEEASAVPSTLAPIEEPHPGRVTSLEAAPGQSATTGAEVVLGEHTSSMERVLWRVSSQANPHLLIVGLPGMGKTTCLIQLCRQLVEQNIAPIVFSYHEDIDEKLERLLPQTFTTVDCDRLGFNPLQIVGEKAHAYMDNVSMLRDIFAAIFPELGDIQLGLIREALKRSYTDRGWSSTSRGDIPPFNAFFDILQVQPKPDKGVMLRLTELADYGFFEAASGSTSLLDSTRAAIVRIHGTQNEKLQRGFASFVLHNIYQAMFRRGPQDRITHAIVFDEAHRAAKLKLIPTMAKECRKFGLALVVASQEVKDFDDSLFNAVSSYLALRVGESDAKRMARAIAPTDKVALYADRIKQTEKYKAWYQAEGMKAPVSIRLTDSAPS